MSLFKKKGEPGVYGASTVLREDAGSKATMSVPIPKRSGPAENPYLSARRNWNEHVGSVVTRSQAWQFLALVSLMVTLVAVGGAVYIGSQSKFIPYVVEVDSVGRVAAQGPLAAAAPVDERVLRAAAADFITSSRMVTPDIELQRKAIFRVYGFLSTNDPATTRMNEWLNGDPSRTPFARAATVLVSTEIQSILRQTPETLEIIWVESTRGRDGVLTKKPETWRALLTMYVTDTAETQTEEKVRLNPLGIFVRDFSWSQVVEQQNVSPEGSK